MAQAILGNAQSRYPTTVAAFGHSRLTAAADREYAVSRPAVHSLCTCYRSNLRYENAKAFLSYCCERSFIQAHFESVLPQQGWWSLFRVSLHVGQIDLPLLTGDCRIRSPASFQACCAAGAGQADGFSARLESALGAVAVRLMGQELLLEFP